jgi:hypothetical protein
MKIEIKKFGDMLVSRPAGREAFLSLESGMLINLPFETEIIIDFKGVKAIAPSWADEVVTKISQNFKNVKLINTENLTVQATLKTLKEYSDLKLEF